MSLQRLGSRALLALLLVLAQQVGGLHRLGHAADALAGLPQAEVCDACLALATLDTPAVDAVWAAPTWPAFQAPPARDLAIASGATGAPCAYRSRAPPRRA